MEVTEVRIKLINKPEDRLRGFCSVTFDNCFVVRDLKIIEGNSGPFVAMPSRKLTDHCSKCHSKNHLRANFCNQCGAKLAHGPVEHDSGGRAKLYADVAHPVNAACREKIQRHVVEELKKEIELSSQPGYSPRYDKDYFDEDVGPEETLSNGGEVQASDSDKRQTSPDGAANKTQAPAGEPVNNGSSGKLIIDSAEEKPYKTHKPNDELSELAKSNEEDFGKGVFE